MVPVGHVKIVELFIAANAIDVNQANVASPPVRCSKIRTLPWSLVQDNVTLLRVAATFGRLGIVQQLLKASNVRVNATTKISSATSYTYTVVSEHSRSPAFCVARQNATVSRGGGWQAGASRGT